MRWRQRCVHVFATSPQKEGFRYERSIHLGTAHRPAPRINASTRSTTALSILSIRKQYAWQAYKIMHGLWGMGQMMFSKYIVIVDEDVDVHDTSQVLFRLCANTDPQRDSVFTRGPSDVLDHATSELATGSKLGFDATRKMAGEGFHRPWPPLIKMPPEILARMRERFQ